MGCGVSKPESESGGATGVGAAEKAAAAEAKKAPTQPEPKKDEVIIKKDYDYLVIMVLVGDQRVGKSCLLRRFSDDTYTDSYKYTFTDSYMPSVGADFKIRHVSLMDDKTYKLHMWDTPGNELPTASLYYRGAHGVLMVYDVTSQTSFDNVKSVWHEEVKKSCRAGVDVLLVGNKADCDAERQVTTDMGKEFAEQAGITFVETSAKSGSSVDMAFVMLAHDIKGKLGQSSAARPPRDDSEGADVQAADKYGMTALMKAAMAGQKIARQTKR